MMTLETLLNATSELASRTAVQVAPAFESEHPSVVEVLEYVDAVCQAILLSHGIVRFNRATEFIYGTFEKSWAALRQELEGVVAVS